MNILDELKWRGAINQETDHDGLNDLVNKSLSESMLELIQLVTVCILVI